MRPLGQPERMPVSAAEQLEHYGPLVPAYRPERTFIIGAPVDATGAGHFRELSPRDDLPVLAVPLGQDAHVFGRLRRASGQEHVVVNVEYFFLAVVRHHESALRSISTFGVPAWYRFMKELVNGKAMHVCLVDHAL